MRALRAPPSSSGLGLVMSANAAPPDDGMIPLEKKSSRQIMTEDPAAPLW